MKKLLSYFLVISLFLFSALSVRAEEKAKGDEEEEKEKIELEKIKSIKEKYQPNLVVLKFERTLLTSTTMESGEKAYYATAKSVEYEAGFAYNNVIITHLTPTLINPANINPFKAIKIVIASPSNGQIKVEEKEVELIAIDRKYSLAFFELKDKSFQLPAIEFEQVSLKEFDKIFVLTKDLALGLGFPVKVSKGRIPKAIKANGVVGYELNTPPFSLVLNEEYKPIALSIPADFVTTCDLRMLKFSAGSTMSTYAMDIVESVMWGKQPAIINILIDKEQLSRLVEKAKSTKLTPWLGVEKKDLAYVTEAMRKVYNIPEDKKGVFIYSLSTKNSPLADAGLKAGDIIVEGEGLDFTVPESEISAQIDNFLSKPIGKVFWIKYLSRTEKEKYQENYANVVPILKPENSWLGFMNVTSVPKELLKEIGLPEYKGAIFVQSVYDNSPVADFQYGDIILKVGDIDFTTVGPFRFTMLETLLPVGEEVEIVFLRKGDDGKYQQMTKKVRPIKNPVNGYIGVEPGCLKMVDDNTIKLLGISPEFKGYLLVLATKPPAIAGRRVAQELLKKEGAEFYQRYRAGATIPPPVTVPRYEPYFSAGTILLRIGNVDLKVKDETEIPAKLKALSEIPADQSIIMDVLTPVPSEAKEPRRGFFGFGEPTPSVPKGKEFMFMYERKLLQLSLQEKIPEVWLGLTSAELKPIPEVIALKEGIPLTKRGLKLEKDPLRDSPFYNAGLRKGDIIYEVNNINLTDEAMSENTTRFNLIEKVAPNKGISVKFLRKKGAEYIDQKVVVTPVEKLYWKNSWLDLNKDNVQVVSLSKLTHYKVPADFRNKNGVRIVDVIKKSSPLAEAGISPGDIILSIGQYDFTDKGEEAALQMLEKITKEALGTSFHVKYLEYQGFKFIFKNKVVTTTAEPERPLWIGLRIDNLEPISPNVAELAGIPENKRGLKIASLSFYSPLKEKYGLRENDILIKLGKIDMVSLDIRTATSELDKYLSTLTRDTEVEIVYLSEREGFSEKKISIKPFETPITSSELAPYMEPALGFAVLPITVDVLEAMRYNEKVEGLVTAGWHPKLGEALISGVWGRGSLIVGVGKAIGSLEKVTTVKRFIELMDEYRKDKVEKVVLEVIEGKETRFKDIKADWEL